MILLEFTGYNKIYYTAFLRVKCNVAHIFIYFTYYPVTFINFPFTFRVECAVECAEWNVQCGVRSGMRSVRCYLPVQCGGALAVWRCTVPALLFFTHICASRFLCCASSHVICMLACSHTMRTWRHCIYYIYRTALINRFNSFFKLKCFSVSYTIKAFCYDLSSSRQRPVFASQQTIGYTASLKHTPNSIMTSLKILVKIKYSKG